MTTGLAPEISPRTKFARKGRPPREKRGRRQRSVPGDTKVYVKRTRTTQAEVFYADFREFADVGGACEALRADGSRRATADLAEALDLYARRRAHYMALRENRATPQRPITHLGPMLALHLKQKAAAKKTRPSTLERMEQAAKALLRAFGNCPLHDLTPLRLQEYVRTRPQEQAVRTGQRISTATLRIELSMLSDMFNRAVSYEYVTKNPVRLIPDKPQAPPPRNVWLTREEGARLLDAAAEHDALARGDSPTAAKWQLAPDDAVWQDSDRKAKKQGRTVQWEKRRNDSEALLGTLLYTGGRIAEVLDLTVGEIDFDAAVVRIRAHETRKLKRDWHARDVQLWPPLAAILERHVEENHLTATDPLFPQKPGSARSITRIDKLLARCCRRAGLTKKHVSPHVLRHTFATMLLRTDVRASEGRRVQRSAFDVAKALGHCSSQLVDRVYGHPSHEECMPTLTYEMDRRHPINERG